MNSYRSSCMSQSTACNSTTQSRSRATHACSQRQCQKVAEPASIHSALRDVSSEASPPVSFSGIALEWRSSMAFATNTAFPRRRGQKARQIRQVFRSGRPSNPTGFCRPCRVTARLDLRIVVRSFMDWPDAASRRGLDEV